MVVNYGRAELLRACLKSLLDQTWPRHIHNFTSRALIELLGRSGFRVRRVRHFSLRDNAAALEAALGRGATVTVFATAE